MRHPHVLRDLALFVEVAKRGSFSRAAQALDMPISSLSRRIMLFEAAVGLRLIERTTRKLTLTRHGETYLPRAAELVEGAQRAVDDMLAEAKAPSVSLRVAVARQPWLQGVIAAALAEIALPEHVRLHFVRGADAEGCDLAITVGGWADPASDIRALVDLEVGLYASPAYLRDRGMPFDPHDLERLDAVLVGPKHSAEWRLLRRAEAVLVRASGHIACDHADLARLHAINGQGVIAAIAPATADDVRCSRLVRLLPEWGLAPMSLRVAVTRTPLPSEARVWRDKLVDRIAAVVLSTRG